MIKVNVYDEKNSLVAYHLVSVPKNLSRAATIKDHFLGHLAICKTAVVDEGKELNIQRLKAEMSFRFGWKFLHVDEISITVDDIVPDL